MTMRTPELSLYLTTYTDGPHHDWRATLEYACAMDAAGVDRVVVSDHVVFGENLDAYGNPTIGGQADGRQPTGPDGSWLEPLTVLTAIAATTTRIGLGAAILLAALRRPAVLAKQLATLDVLSEGRVDLGVGVGWQREEYEAAGLSFEDRGEQCCRAPNCPLRERLDPVGAGARGCARRDRRDEGQGARVRRRTTGLQVQVLRGQ
jgi:alkanesulfonate monooxygenase SsuD/methylene tetrahydromethanopterin reductase-like flavin-dependent oxidoreductase (luciferase family)